MSYEFFDGELLMAIPIELFRVTLLRRLASLRRCKE
jgi:hypothetical protein